MMMDVKDLSVARGGVTVLEGVGFRLDPGQVVVLRGPNGIGKTTLLRTLAGLQPPVAGEVGGRGDRLCRPCRRAEGRTDRGRESAVLGGRSMAWTGSRRQWRR